MNASYVHAKEQSAREIYFQPKTSMPIQGGHAQATLRYLKSPLRVAASPGGATSSAVQFFLRKPDLRSGRYSPFVERITELLEARIDDETYSIDQLCKDAGISRAQLHRNLKTSTGLSTSIFIRRIRLKKAKDLLLSTELNISQVAFDVGFNDPRYFSVVFYKEFDQSPRDFRKNPRPAPKTD